jgi:hypothetical protein
MTNMKLSAKQQSEPMPEACEPKAPEYPWGLQIRIDEDSLKKLGIEGLPEIGQSLMLNARVQVCEVSQFESANSGLNRNMTLQITDMEIGKEAPKKRNAAKDLYGGDDSHSE